MISVGLTSYKVEPLEVGYSLFFCLGVFLVGVLTGLLDDLIETIGDFFAFFFSPKLSFELEISLLSREFFSRIGSYLSLRRPSYPKILSELLPLYGVIKDFCLIALPNWIEAFEDGSGDKDPLIPAIIVCLR